MFLTYIVCRKDIESSRSYIDELYSSDTASVVEALVTLKNAVIGSNRQKSSVIQQGVVPRLLQLMTDPDMDPAIRLEATITIGETKLSALKFHKIIIIFRCILVEIKFKNIAAADTKSIQGIIA